MKKIHKEMLVGEIVTAFPEAADIITSYGLHCVGCSANAYETLEQGMLGHGFTVEQLKKMVDELNEYWEEFQGESASKEKDALHPKADDFSIVVTDSALKKIVAAAKEQKKTHLQILPQDIAGVMKFKLNFIEPEELHTLEKIFPFKKDAIKIVVHKQWYPQLEGLTIDYVIESDREGFKINAPQPHSARTAPSTAGRSGKAPKRSKRG